MSETLERWRLILLMLLLNFQTCCRRRLSHFSSFRSHLLSGRLWPLMTRTHHQNLTADRWRVKPHKEQRQQQFKVFDLCSTFQAEISQLLLWNFIHSWSWKDESHWIKMLISTKCSARSQAQDVTYLRLVTSLHVRRRRCSLAPEWDNKNTSASVWHDESSPETGGGRGHAHATSPVFS